MSVIVIVPGGTAAPPAVTVDGLTNIRKAAIALIIDGGGSTIGAGQKGTLEIPFDCTIDSVELLADRSGSVVVDIYKTTYAAYDVTTHPLVADKITGTSKPTISSATKYTDSTLSGWTVAISAGDVLAFNIDSVATIQRLTATLNVSKT